MATTYDTTGTIESRQRSNAGFVRRLFDHFALAQQREANRRILSHLRSLNIDTLKHLGYTDEQIRLIAGNDGGATRDL